MDGALIVESLRVGAELTLPLRLRKISRYEITEPAPGQPTTWTLIEFETDDQRADELAAALADVLLDAGGWYADFHTPSTKYVVFAGRVFSFPRGEKQANSEARDYGRSKGVPEQQLDWAD